MLAASTQAHRQINSPPLRTPTPLPPPPPVAPQTNGKANCWHCRKSHAHIAPQRCHNDANNDTTPGHSCSAELHTRELQACNGSCDAYGAQHHYASGTLRFFLQAIAKSVLSTAKHMLSTVGMGALAIGIASGLQPMFYGRWRMYMSESRLRRGYVRVARAPRGI